MRKEVDYELWLDHLPEDKKINQVKFVSSGERRIRTTDGTMLSNKKHFASKEEYTRQARELKKLISSLQKEKLKSNYVEDRYESNYTDDEKKIHVTVIDTHTNIYVEFEFLEKM